MNKVFQENPNLKEFYKTSDGTPFYSHNAAQNHAKTLEDKSIEKVERPAGKVVDMKGKKSLKEMTKEELLKKATSLEIEVKDENEAELIILIEAKIAELEASGAGAGSGGDDTKKEKALKNMNRAELDEKATALEIEIPEGATNKDIVKLIEAKIAESAGN